MPSTRWLPFLLSNGNTANTQSLVYTSALELEMYGDDFFKDSDAGNANTLWHEAGRLDRKVAENGGFWGPSPALTFFLASRAKRPRLLSLHFRTVAHVFDI